MREDKTDWPFYGEIIAATIAMLALVGAVYLALHVGG